MHKAFVAWWDSGNENPKDFNALVKRVLDEERERCINVLKNRKIGFANQDLMLDEMIAEIIALGD